MFIYSYRTGIQLWNEFEFEEPIYSEKIKVGKDGNPLTANTVAQKALTAAEFLGIDNKEIPNAGKFAQSDNDSKKVKDALQNEAKLSNDSSPLIQAKGKKSEGNSEGSGPNVTLMAKWHYVGQHKMDIN